MPLPALAQQHPLVLMYHHGPLLKGNVSVNLVWYGHFSPSQRFIVFDFRYSLVPQRLPLPSPSASSWWKTTEKYSPSAGVRPSSRPHGGPALSLTACAGEFGSGSYPGYPDKVLVDTITGGSYNANGANGRKFLLPAMWDPQFSVYEMLV
ncbi:hypothetical protein MLD38_037628 [Melastoma candidum]|uniref:Uncharacterized protein n=1 Tax=Melastoma candidum TaxID=119954 RepID=A0ACB9LNL6_9MYRT|nr:hypothetical protein MLD38_037628 [Melastoma candidum]